jgi:hypothetical protein
MKFNNSMIMYNFSLNIFYEYFLINFIIWNFPLNRYSQSFTNKN